MDEEREEKKRSFIDGTHALSANSITVITLTIDFRSSSSTGVYV